MLFKGSAILLCQNHCSAVSPASLKQQLGQPGLDSERNSDLLVLRGSGPVAEGRENPARAILSLLTLVLGWGDLGTVSNELPNCEVL